MFSYIEMKAETRTAKTNESVVQEIDGNPFIFLSFFVLYVRDWMSIMW